jgi:integrase
MPRYRFQWSHHPDRVLLALCREVGLDLGDPVASLRRRYGARPEEDFAKQAFHVIIDVWLGHNRNLRRAVIVDLRAAGLGGHLVTWRSPLKEKAYLRGIRNTKSARKILLDRFIKAGEMRPFGRPGSQSENGGEAPERPLRVWDPGYHKGRVPANRGRTYPVEILTPEEVVALMRACPLSTRGIRMRALITVLYRSGLRISEALQLYPKDIAPGSGTIRVLRGAKTGRPRTVGCDPAAMGVIVEWLELRRRLGAPAAAPVFCTYMTGRWTAVNSSYVRGLLSKLAREAGITKRVHPHGLRHAHAFELAMEGVNVLVIMRQLGHSWLNSTMVYVDHIAPLETIRTMQARKWEALDGPGQVLALRFSTGGAQ